MTRLYVGSRDPIPELADFGERIDDYTHLPSGEILPYPFLYENGVVWLTENLDYQEPLWRWEE